MRRKLGSAPFFLPFIPMTRYRLLLTWWRVIAYYWRYDSLLWFSRVIFVNSRLFTIRIVFVCVVFDILCPSFSTPAIFIRDDCGFLGRSVVFFGLAVFFFSGVQLATTFRQSSIHTVNVLDFSYFLFISCRYEPFRKNTRSTQILCSRWTPSSLI